MTVPLSRDPSDQPFLALALFAEADALVTGGPGFARHGAGGIGAHPDPSGFPAGLAEPEGTRRVSALNPNRMQAGAPFGAFSSSQVRACSERELPGRKAWRRLQRAHRRLAPFRRRY